MTVAAKFSWTLAAIGLVAVIIGAPVIKLAGGVMAMLAVAYLSRGRDAANTSGDPGIPDAGHSGGADGGGHGGGDAG
jgi:hypothetical protein